MTWTRLAPAIAFSAALAACGHARQGSLVRSPVDGDDRAARVEPGATGSGNVAPVLPADDAAASVPAPATAAVPASGDAAPAARPAGEPAIATASAPTPVHVARAKPGAAEGALRGAGVVLYVFGRLCVAGGAYTMIGCVALVYFGWPYLVGTVAAGAAIGAAVGAEPRAPSAGRPPDPLPAATSDPATSWGGS